MADTTEVLVSVLVAAYNMEKMIDRCLQSLVNQSMQEIEIIVVDDGSTDATGDICEKYAHLDSKVKVIHHQENRGLPMARQTGLKAAKGKFIKFVDSDDWCETNMCECLYKKAIEMNADIVFCSAYRHREDGIAKICNLPLDSGLYNVQELYDSYILPLYGDLKEDKLVTTGYVWCCLFRKQLIEEIDFYKEINLHEDEIIVLQAMISAQTVFITDDALYHYNRRTNTMSKKSCYWEGYWDNMVAVFLAKKKYGRKLFEREQEYMFRLVTTLYLKFFRSIRNETHYMNPDKFWGGLRNLYSLKDKKYLRKYKKYLLYQELTPVECVLAKLIQHKLYFVPYFYYALKCGRMRHFQEKIKN